MQVIVILIIYSVFTFYIVYSITIKNVLRKYSVFALEKLCFIGLITLFLSEYAKNNYERYLTKQAAILFNQEIPVMPMLLPSLDQEAAYNTLFFWVILRFLNICFIVIFLKEILKHIEENRITLWVEERLDIIYLSKWCPGHGSILIQLKKEKSAIIKDITAKIKTFK